MIAKSSLTILFLMLITCLRRSSSMSLRLAQICQRHQDCGLFSICENGWCRPIRSLTDLEKKKPVVCATFFKAPCSSDTDCFCKAGSMICEANECVVRSTLNSSNDFKK